MEDNKEEDYVEEASVENSKKEDDLKNNKEENYDNEEDVENNKDGDGDNREEEGGGGHSSVSHLPKGRNKSSPPPTLTLTRV